MTLEIVLALGLVLAGECAGEELFFFSISMQLHMPLLVEFLALHAACEGESTNGALSLLVLHLMNHHHLFKSFCSNNCTSSSASGIS